MWGLIKIDITAVILAAGSGSRMKTGKSNAEKSNAEKSKMFINLKDPVIVHTLRPFEEHAMVNSIVVVSPKSDIEETKSLIKNFNFGKVSAVIEGGDTRQESSFNGVMHTESDFIIIHDGARPLIRKDAINNAIRDAITYGASVVAVPSKDTIKEAAGGVVEKTIDRRTTWIAQTPQVFRSEAIKESHKKARDDNFTATDDSMLVERMGYKVRVTPGSYENIKITTPEDIEIAKKILERGEEYV